MKHILLDTITRLNIVAQFNIVARLNTVTSLDTHANRSQWSLVGLVLALLLAATPVLADSPTYGSKHQSYRVVPVVEGLQNPWSMAFLPNGDLLITERAGRLRVARGGQLLPEPVAGLPAVRVGGQGGLLDVVLHPQFDRNRLVYLSYSKPNADGTQGTTAVIRGRFENHRLHEVEEIFEAQAWSERTGHYGSRLVFDGDGYLFITVGDRQTPATGDLEAHPAQDLSNHIGTTLRLHDDGRVPQDNPFVSREGALPEIWSYGHRNAQGMAIDPVTGELWQNEHGPQGGDELNLILPGRNYGWPVVGHGVNYGSGTIIHAATRREGMEQPVHFWTPSIGVSGMVIYSGDAFPAWRGSIFNGGLSGNYQVLARIEVEGRAFDGEELLLQREMRIRDLRQGPDGYIYIAVDDRGGQLTSIVRVEPVN